MKRFSLLFFLAASVAGLQFLTGAEGDRFVYPRPPKSNQVDSYFGTKIADPYRDLEKRRLRADQEMDRGGK